MTMILSLLSDLLSVLTIHLYICYLLATTIFSQQLSMLGSLWNLFRGMFALYDACEATHELATILYSRKAI